MAALRHRVPPGPRRSNSPALQLVAEERGAEVNDFNCFIRARLQASKPAKISSRNVFATRCGGCERKHCRYEPLEILQPNAVRARTQYNTPHQRRQRRSMSCLAGAGSASSMCAGQHALSPVEHTQNTSVGQVWAGNITHAARHVACMCKCGRLAGDLQHEGLAAWCCR